MKKSSLNGILVVFSLFWVSCENKTKDHSHHHDRQGMTTDNFVNQTTSIDSGLYEVIASVNQIVISNQQTVRPIIRENKDLISADGYIASDERRNNNVAARFGGRIEKLYVKYNYKYVRKGEKIVELYSPEVNTIMGEFIHHLENISDKDLIQKTKEKLLLLSLTEEQIQIIEKTAEPLETISIYSPYEGYVFFNNGERKMNPEINLSQTKGMDMSTAPGNKSLMTGTVDQIKEGSYVSKGRVLFVINDLKEVWAMAAFASKDGSKLQHGSKAKVKSELIGFPVNAAISFIEPFYQSGQKFIQARIYLNNNRQQFKVGSLISVEISEELKALSIPGSAVLDLGWRKIVWVIKGITKGGNKFFEARSIATGSEAGEYVQVISGITEKDEIAKDAGFMIDSESLIK